MKKGFRGKFLRWFRIWCQNWCFCFFKWYKRRKRWILSKIKNLEMMHILLLSPIPNVKTWREGLTLDSEEAWKFIPKNLLREPFQLCFSPIWCLFWHNRSKMSEKIAKSSASLYFIYVLNFSLKKYFSVTNREAKN